MQNLFGIIALSSTIEGLVEYTFGQLSNGKPNPHLKYIALIFGMFVASVYQIDLIAMLGFSVQAGPLQYVSYLLSGLLIGRGSNYMNDFVTLIRNKSLPTTPTLVLVPPSIKPDPQVPVEPVVPAEFNG